MAGNAHRNRKRSKPCSSDCKFCKARPKFGDYKNSTGHRHNPNRKHGGRRNPKANVAPKKN